MTIHLPADRSPSEGEMVTTEVDGTVVAVARVDGALYAFADECTHAACSLSDGDRDVLLLHAWADLSMEQIASALLIPTGTVRSRLFRARKILRETAVNPTSKESDHGRVDSAATA